MNVQENIVPKNMLSSEWNDCESESAATDWKLWCRLCAKDSQNNMSVFFKEEQQTGGNGPNHGHLSLEEAIKKYFWVNIIRDEELPKVVCTDCYTLVTSLVNFSERVSKVQKMFCTLQHSYEIDKLDLPSLRIKYGLNDGESEHTNMQQGVTELQFFETKPQLNELNEKVLEVELIEADPLEHAPIEIKFKEENLLDEVVETGENIDNESEDFVPKVSKKVVKRAKIVRNCAKKQTKQTTQLKNTTMKHSVRSTDKHTDTGDNGKIFSCPECPNQFKRLIHFRYHMKRAHPELSDGNIKKSESEFRCGECARVCLTKHNLERHIKTHLPTPCSYCNKTFTSNYYIQKHIELVHSNKCEIICEKCGVAIKTKERLNEHMLTHTDYAPFECDVCKKGFKNKRRLKMHMETHDPSKHICRECGLELNSRTTLNNHLLVHSDKMQHKCDYCGRAFKRAKTLKIHLILHTGLKPYSCDFCDRTFANGSNCRTHKKKAHPEELAALEAAGCGKAYTRNIPKLEALKSVTKTGENLATVVSKPSGCFSLGKKPKAQLNETNENSISEHNTQTPTTNTVIALATTSPKICIPQTNREEY